MTKQTTVCHGALAMARRVTTGMGTKPKLPYRTGVSPPLSLFEQKQFCRQSGYELSSIETILILQSMFHLGDMLFYCVMEGNKIMSLKPSQSV